MNYSIKEHWIKMDQMDTRKSRKSLEARNKLHYITQQQLLPNFVVWNKVKRPKGGMENLIIERVA